MAGATEVTGELSELQAGAWFLMTFQVLEVLPEALVKVAIRTLGLAEPEVMRSPEVILASGPGGRGPPFNVQVTAHAPSLGMTPKTCAVVGTAETL